MGSFGVGGMPALEVVADGFESRADLIGGRDHFLVGHCGSFAVRDLGLSVCPRTGPLARVSSHQTLSSKKTGIGRA